MVDIKHASSRNSDEKIDEEWLELIVEAKNNGLTLEQLSNYIEETRKTGSKVND